MIGNERRDLWWNARGAAFDGGKPFELGAPLIMWSDLFLCDPPPFLDVSLHSVELKTS